MRAANPSVAGSTSSFGGSADADGSAFTSIGGSHLLGGDLRHAPHAATTAKPTISETLLAGALTPLDAIEPSSLHQRLWVF